MVSHILCPWLQSLILFSGAVMGKNLHLFQRGPVFYWRRRVPGLSTSIDMLQLSLRNTNESVYVEPSPLRDLQMAINALSVVDDQVRG